MNEITAVGNLYIATVFLIGSGVILSYGIRTKRFKLEVGYGTWASQSKLFVWTGVLFFVSCAVSFVVHAFAPWPSIYKPIEPFWTLLQAIVITVFLGYAVRIEVKRWISPEQAVKLIAKFKAITDSGPPFYCLDMDNNCIAANEPFCRLIGYSEAALIGKNMHHLIHHKHKNGKIFPESECAIFQSLRLYRSSKKHRDTFWDSAQQAVPIKWYCTPITINDEVVGMRIDVTKLTAKESINGPRPKPKAGRGEDVGHED